MASVTPTLLSYDATTKQKMFKLQLDDGTTATYFGNVEKNDDVFDKNVNSNRFCCYMDGKVLHNMYDSSRVIYHGLAARRHRYLYAKADDFQHIYKGIVKNDLSTYIDNSIQSAVKVQDAIYGIDSPKTFGHSFVNDELYDWLAQDNGYPLPKTFEYKTMLYDKDGLSAASTPKAIKAELSGIQYNTLYEIPGNLYTDYSSGSMYATTVKCKNVLDSRYNMSDDDIRPINCRFYDKIYSCNNQVYLQFKDLSAYNRGSKITTLSIDCGDVDGNGDKVFHEIGISAISDPGPRAPNTKIPQVEYIENINRGASASKHKSSLYSLRLTSPALESLQDSDQNSFNSQIRENVRQEVKNVIRSLAERISPANSQLFFVTVNGK